MGILNLLKPKKKQFVSEIDFITNRDQQSYLAVETLVGLRELNVEESDAFSINFCFRTDSLEKLLQLIEALQLLNYSVKLTDNKKLFVVKGKTTSIKMTHEVLKKWAIDMCILGYKHDCHFENWNIVT